MNQLLPFLILSELAGNGAEVMRRVLPATLPGSTGLVFAALAAKKDIQRQERADEAIVKEVATTAGITNAEALKGKFPKLYDLYAKLPKAAQDDIFTPAPAGDKPLRK